MNTAKRKTLSTTSTEDSSDNSVVADDDTSSSDDDDDGPTSSPSTAGGPRKRLKTYSESYGFNPNEAASSGGGGGAINHMVDFPTHPSVTGGLGYSASSSRIESSSDESATNNSAATSTEYNNYSNKSMMMMQKMGFKPDKGLGKTGQGRIAPIEASEQKGRRGLGLKLDGLDNAAVKFDPTMEHFQMRETAEWLHSSGDDDNLDDLNRDRLEKWIILGTTKMTIDDESKFCDPDVLANVLSSKSIFDNLGAVDMRRARTRSNPFETIRGAFFLNRAAVKMANMDSIFDFMFTDPLDEHGGRLVRDDDLLYFADVCAGPGGFSEYVLWRKGWQAKGFGFTLRKENDFKLHDFFAGSPATFEPYYGIHEDGNVFDPENIESLRKHVLGQTQDCGVHFMMADGGFSVEGQENVQEILSKELYLCQCLVALAIVREKGHFVVKLFDLFTSFSVGLVYLMYKCFQQICIFKPNTSRPANSERYLVCKWKKANTDTIYRHLFDINEVMFKNPNDNKDFLELVPYDVLKGDEKFFNYIYESNNTIGRNQIAGLLKIAAYCKDPTLMETRQKQIRIDCLNLWKLPDRMRKQPAKQTNEQLFMELIGKWRDQKDFLDTPDKLLTPESTMDIQWMLSNMQHWYFVPVAKDDTARTLRTFFMCKENNRTILRYTSAGSWLELNDIYLELSPNTLIYGEITKELTGEGGSQTMMYALHIIDGIVLGGQDIRMLPLRKRLQMCDKFARALNKPNKSVNNGRDGGTAYMAPISCRKLWAMRDFCSFFDRLSYYRLKDKRERYGLKLRDNTHGPDRFFVPTGLMFLCELKPNLQLSFSKSQQKHYYYDGPQKRAFFLDQLNSADEIFGSFRSTYMCRKLWQWSNADQVSDNKEARSDPSLLYRTDLADHISSKLMNHH